MYCGRIFAGAILCAGLILTSSESGAQSASSLEGTHWIGDADCFITDLYFEKDGEVDIFYDADDDDDFGDWTLTGQYLTIEFFFYEDETFMATYDGATIRAVHTFKFKDEANTTTENCVFRRR